MERVSLTLREAHGLQPMGLGVSRPSGLGFQIFVLVGGADFDFILARAGAGDHQQAEHNS